MLAIVHIDKNCKRIGSTGKNPRQRIDNAFIVHRNGETHRGESIGERRDTFDRRTDRLVSEQHIRPPCAGHHLRLGNRRALEANDTRVDMHADDLGHLVGFDVRPQP